MSKLEEKKCERNEQTKEAYTNDDEYEMKKMRRICICFC